VLSNNQQVQKTKTLQKEENEHKLDIFFKEVFTKIVFEAARVLDNNGFDYLLLLFGAS